MLFFIFCDSEVNICMNTTQFLEFGMLIEQKQMFD